MRAIITKRVPLAWLLMLLIATGASGIVYKLAVIDRPPSDAVLISEPGSTPQVSTTPGQAGAGAQRTGTPITTVEGAAFVPKSPATPPPIATSPVEVIIEVYVSGAVARPGVYKLPQGARVVDAVSAAGGQLPDADMEQINLAERVADEEHISVPTHSASLTAVAAGATAVPRGVAAQPTQVKRTTPQPAAKPALINVNVATEAELEAVPGIGPVMAQRIIDNRTQNGPFASMDDLKRIPGIKDGILARLQPYVFVGPP